MKAGSLKAALLPEKMRMPPRARAYRPPGVAGGRAGGRAGGEGGGAMGGLGASNIGTGGGGDGPAMVTTRITVAPADSMPMPVLASQVVVDQSSMLWTTF